MSAIRLDNNTSKLIDKLIEYKFSRTRADGFRWIMQNGMQKAKKAVEQKEKSQSIIRKWKETGLPEFPDDLSELSIKERK